MDAMSKLHKTFDIPNAKKENAPKNKTSSPMTAHYSAAASHVQKNTNQRPNNIKDKYIKSNAGKLSGLTQIINKKLSDTNPTNNIGTTTAACPASPVKSSNPNTLFQFKSLYDTPFNARVEDQFFNSLNSKAKNLAEKYRLTKSEAAAIHAYTKNQYYENMNGALRAVSKNGKVDASDADDLMSAGIKDPELAFMIASAVRGMKKLPATQTSNDYFVALGRNDSIPDELLVPFETGASVTIPSFFSTTISSTVVEDWWDKKDQALCIFQRENGNGRDITAFSASPNEKEILFIPGTMFMVLARTEPTETPPPDIRIRARSKSRH